MPNAFTSLRTNSQPMSLAQLREHHPEYDDLTDMQVATRLHQKHDPGRPFEDFARLIGFTPEPRPAPARAQEPTTAPDPAETEQPSGYFSDKDLALKKQYPIFPAEGEKFVPKDTILNFLLHAVIAEKTAIRHGDRKRGWKTIKNELRRDLQRLSGGRRGNALSQKYYFLGKTE